MGTLLSCHDVLHRVLSLLCIGDLPAVARTCRVLEARVRERGCVLDWPTVRLADWRGLQRCRTLVIRVRDGAARPVPARPLRALEALCLRVEEGAVLSAVAQAALAATVRELVPWGRLRVLDAVVPPGGILGCPDPATQTHLGPARPPDALRVRDRAQRRNPAAGARAGGGGGPVHALSVPLRALGRHLPGLPGGEPRVLGAATDCLPRPVAVTAHTCESYWCRTVTRCASCSASCPSAPSPA